jgi:hypothetical protein
MLMYGYLRPDREFQHLEPLSRGIHKTNLKKHRTFGEIIGQKRLVAWKTNHPRRFYLCSLFDAFRTLHEKRIQ